MVLLVALLVGNSIRSYSAERQQQQLEDSLIQEQKERSQLKVQVIVNVNSFNAEYLCRRGPKKQMLILLNILLDKRRKKIGFWSERNRQSQADKLLQTLVDTVGTSRMSAIIARVPLLYFTRQKL